MPVPCCVDREEDELYAKVDDPKNGSIVLKLVF